MHSIEHQRTQAQARQHTKARQMGSAWIASAFAMVLALAWVVPLTGCQSKEPRRRAAPVQLRGQSDIPPILRGTIGAEATINGARPTMVSGLGYVVGLNGTGGGLLPENIATQMEDTMSRFGVGRGDLFDGTPLAGMSPGQALRDPNTAVVLVQAAIPPSLPESTTFDVYVRALNATSLEGGRLWTTELRLGNLSTDPSAQTHLIAEASGEIFINPFAEPGAENDGVTRNVGRVLDGGRMLDPLEMQLVLTNPSHARARFMTSAINSRFPAINERTPIATGRDDTSVDLRMPRSYRNKPAEFLSLVTHLRVDPSFPEMAAHRYATAMADSPDMINELSFSLEAIGDQAIPRLQDLYNTADLGPRIGALRAGAALGDVRAAQTLIRMLDRGEEGVEPGVIRLLSRIDAGPRVDQTLRRMLEHDELATRVAAYEGLVQRAATRNFGRAIERMDSRQRVHTNTERLYEQTRRVLDASSIQGISRRPISDQVLLDRIPVGDPLVYITQSGEPRIALFGEPQSLRLDTPLLVSMWSDRLLLVADGANLPIRMYYRDLRGRAVNIEDVPADLGELLIVMARTPTPEDPRPGLGLGYAELVGVLHEFYRQGVIPAAFATERDRLYAELLSLNERNSVTLRPENDNASEVVVFDPTPRTRQEQTDTAVPDSLLTPLNAPPSADPATDPEGDGSGQTSQRE